MSKFLAVWTAELAKLREKGRAALSRIAAAEVDTLSLPTEPEELSLDYAAAANRRGKRMERRRRPSAQVLPQSTDAGVSMLLHCFSP